MISIIVALSKNHVIGIKNTIPWFLPKDLLWFKKNTLNKPVVMGRMTWESIGFPLFGRKNIVVSKNKKKLRHENCIKLVTSINEAISICKNSKEIMIIGGGSIYKQTLPKVDRLYLTHIEKKIEGDTYFPSYDPDEWNSVFKEFHDIDKQHLYEYCFEILERRK